MSHTETSHTDVAPCNCTDCLCAALDSALQSDALKHALEKRRTDDDEACSCCESELYCVCELLIEHGHCPDCLYENCRCDEYQWEEYGQFNNCRTGDCRECVGRHIERSGYCPWCYKKECVCVKVESPEPPQEITTLDKCDKCDKCDARDAVHCICEMLEMHGYSKSL